MREELTVIYWWLFIISILFILDDQIIRDNTHKIKNKIDSHIYYSDIEFTNHDYMCWEER